LILIIILVLVLAGGEDYGHRSWGYGE
jgi:hypothetical protein